MQSAHAGPTLRSLEVFEVAARLGGFTAAGEELGVTQSAVSRQISDLEATLGVPLFVRNGARVRVTPTGERLARQLATSFADIQSALAEARRSDRVVTLSMLPSVAARWFAPRLGGFLASNPDIDLRLTASRHLVNFAAEGVDAALRYSPAPPPDLEAIRLGSETVTPVCSPIYADEIGLTTPADLYRATLLCGDIAEDWPAWFKAAGCDRPAPSGPRLGDDGAILQAAIDGHGVALGRSLLVADDIASGRLVSPFSTALDASFAYWLVYPRRMQANDAIEAVKSWLVDQFAGATAQ